MNVLQVNKLYYPEIGGIENVVQTIAENLPETYETSVLAAQPRGFGSREQYNGVDVRKVSSLGVAMSVPLAPTFPIGLHSAAQQADVIHHHLPNPLSAFADLTVGKGDSAVIATYHSDIVRQATALKLYRPLLERFLKNVDRILVTSERLMSHSGILSPYEEKCEVVPLSVDIKAIDAESPQTLEVNTKDPVVAFVGRLNYYKGVEYLVDAMVDIDATLLVAGDGPRRSSLEQRAREKGIESRVQFLGYVPDRKLASVYNSADVFVLPSIEPSEAFGIVQLEAMARGVPVVNTSLPTGVPWVSQDEHTGLTVAPRDASALAGAVTTLINNNSLRQRYGANARARVEQMFTQERMLSKIETVYREVTTND